ncbi:MAG: GatB/YqeY domain-containing protein [Bacteroidota bacterium]
MSLEITINDHLKKAMLAKDEKGLRALRAIKAAILLAKTAEGAGDAMTTDAEIKLLQKLVKQRKDSIEIFEQQNRADLAVKEKEEVEVIEQYLPTQMSADEIKLAVAEIIKQTGVVNISRLGQVMGIASKQLAGKADGKTISTIVKEMLTVNG